MDLLMPASTASRRPPDQGRPARGRGRRPDLLHRGGPRRRRPSRPARPGSCSRTPRPTTWPPRSGRRPPARSTSTRPWPASSPAGCAVGPRAAGGRRTGRGTARATALARLTARERDVLAGVARGLSNRAIADELGITERTARTHVSNILAKLGLTSRTQAALLAVEHGLGRAMTADGRRSSPADPSTVRRRRTGRRPGHRLRPRHAADPGAVGRPARATCRDDVPGRRPRPARPRRARATSPFTLDAAADQVAAVIERRRRPDAAAVVVGLSLGGYVAMDLAAASRTLVRGLVLSGATAEPVGLARAARIAAWPGSWTRFAGPRLDALNALVLPDPLPGRRSPSRSSPAASGTPAARPPCGRSSGSASCPRWPPTGSDPVPQRRPRPALPAVRADVRAGRPAAAPGAPGGRDAPRQPRPAGAPSTPPIRRFVDAPSRPAAPTGSGGRVRW